MIINQKIYDVCGQKLVWVVNTIGTTNMPSFIEIRELIQNSLFTEWPLYSLNKLEFWYPVTQ